MSFLLHLGATILCPHGGQANPTSSSRRVRIAGQPAVTQAHSQMIAGCAFTTPDGPKPCLALQWTTPAARVRIEGAPALLSTSSGLTTGPLGVQGAPQVVAQQSCVRGA